MSRYRTPSGAETEYEPGSRKRVLRNRLGIKSKSVMDRAEAQAMARAQETYFFGEIVTADTRVTAAMLKQMHQDWLGDIYEWAGSYRTIDVSKGGFAFPPAYLIPNNMGQFEKDALSVLTPCRPDDVPKICERVAKVHAELLLIHPFREGNGRLARWLANIMFAQAGKTLPDYGFVGAGSRARETSYLQAVIKGYYQDYSELARFFEDALERAYATALSSDSARGEAPSNIDDS